MAECRFRKEHAVRPEQGGAFPWPLPHNLRGPKIELSLGHLWFLHSRGLPSFAFCASPASSVLFDSFDPCHSLWHFPTPIGAPRSLLCTDGIDFYPFFYSFLC